MAGKCHNKSVIHISAAGSSDLQGTVRFARAGCMVLFSENAILLRVIIER